MRKYNGLLEFVRGRKSLLQKRKGFDKVVYALFAATLKYGQIFNFYIELQTKHIFNKTYILQNAKRVPIFIP